MVTDLFGALLSELGKVLKIANLHPDRNNSCLVQMVNGQQFQLELDRTSEFVIVGTQLGAVTPGKYRESLFKEALKANDQPYPLHGILAYSTKTENLFLFMKIHVKDLTGDKIAEEITPFLEKASVWSDAITRSDIPAVGSSQTSKGPAGMFGLRP